MTKKKFAFKLFGSIAVLFIVLGSVLFATGRAQALFRYIGSSFTATGTVASVGADSFTITTSGSTAPITVKVDGGTHFSSGVSSLGSLVVGSNVRVLARQQSDGSLLAKQVRLLNPNFGDYGSGCDPFILRVAIVEVVNPSLIRVNKDGTVLDVNITGDTDIIGGSQSDLTVGKIVAITGDDCIGVDKLIAKKINLQ